MSYIVYVEYSATLVAVMTVLQTRTPVSSVQEFVERDDWSLLMQKGVAYSSDWRVSGRGLQLRLEGQWTWPTAPTGGSVDVAYSSGWKVSGRGQQLRLEGQWAWPTAPTGR